MRAARAYRVPKPYCVNGHAYDDYTRRYATNHTTGYTQVYCLLCRRARNYIPQRGLTFVEGLAVVARDLAASDYPH